MQEHSQKNPVIPGIGDNQTPIRTRRQRRKTGLNKSNASVFDFVPNAAAQDSSTEQTDERNHADFVKELA